MTEETLARPTDDFQLPGIPDIADPYPALTEAARSTPVMYAGNLKLTGLSGRRETYVVYRFDDVVHVLRDEQTYSSAPLKEIAGPVMGRSMLEMAGEEHHRYRSIVAQAFRPKVLARWADDLVRPAAEEIVDRFADQSHADLVAQFNFHFPALVIARVLGLPEEDIATFQRWAVAIIAYAARPDDGVAASHAVREYLAPSVAERRASPKGDLISEIVQAELDGDRLTDDELYPFLLLLLPAGIETTYRGIGNLMFGLLSHPDQLEMIRSDRARIPDAVEEALRWEPPIPMLTRETTCPVELREVEMPEGATITVCPGTANRDPDHWDEPERFDVSRPKKQHLTFGFGPHMCLGAHLARLEMRTACETLLDRLPGLRLDPDAEDVHIHGMAFRSPISLPVLWDTTEG
jgi:cytochrome P450